ncbi:MAG: addiction module protein [Gammaproteobacteria bacterium]
MSTKAEDVLKEALHLPARERASIAEDLLSSLDKPDPEMDRLWAEEAEDRIEAEARGEMQEVAAAKVFGKYEQR